MLIRKKQIKTVSVSVPLSLDDHKRLEQIKSEATRQGFEIDLRGAMQEALLKLMRRAERELQPDRSQPLGASTQPALRESE